MRDAFIDELTKMARNDSRITIVTGDIGNRMFNGFRDEFPGRFLNAGIAEANMTGMAAGMAMAGLRPFTYTIASFNPGRCAEQIRLDVCQHNLPVVIVGVGAGLSYASLGPTHHALEDIAWMRSIPNMTVVCPADPIETRLAVRAALAHNGPVYLRLGKKGEPVVHSTEPDFAIGKAIRVRDGDDAALLAVGTVLPVAMESAKALAERGVAVAVYSFHTVKPLDEELLREVFARYKVAAVIEAHVEAGGTWSAIAEWLAKQGGGHVPLLRFGTDDKFFHQAGGEHYAWERMGISSGNIAAAVCKYLDDAQII